MLPLYSHLNILTLDQLLNLSQANFMYSYHRNSLPVTFRSYCSKPSHTYPTRFSASNFTVPPQQEVSDKSMKVLGPKVWAKVPQVMKLLPFRKTFSKYFKISLIDDLPKYTGRYKPKFQRKSDMSTSLQDMFDADDSDDGTLLGFDSSLNPIYCISR